ncbi:hypothetical Protein YC6258_03423 [Gynuella sunshinyii YC6258]|uniref:Uncharacterized protein n=1 Tax=Gynuella sunshinyii YC6258 TaxID=1445510 RepID=A0A0C5VYI3_9GAMM|nr:hypothetical Protein YC6258_03423 [Gynuella sunshinyii YC6258]
MTRHYISPSRYGEMNNIHPGHKRLRDILWSDIKETVWHR